MQSAKEAAAKTAASAKAGMEKTKATMQEKGEKMTTRDPTMKDIAEEKKDERIRQAELQKQEVQGHNTATRQTPAGTGHTAEGEVPLDQPHDTGRVLQQDPNVAGGATTGHGAGSTY
ncbi:hypothetical protein F511_07616 [Dorcoceras hygrometricum]|uniref:Uncharacterized protein n=1 Tax=Dorcoceras hygrometricum TaxID=472368 RepID=A0A2Z7D1J1_9LAMI|nr:hypothetical protein F511_07616 [Dorcoceras hygrometricum]